MEPLTPASPRPESLPSTKDQLGRVILALVALVYAGYSYLRDDFYIMGKHGPGTHYHGFSAGLLEGMLLAAATACLLPVIGMRDRRPGKPDYELWRRRAAMAAYALMSLGMTLRLFNPTLAMVGGIGPWLLRWAGWLGLGVVAAQLGRLPPSYLKKKGQKQPLEASDSLGPVVAYIAAALLSLIALALLVLAGFIQWRNPGGWWGFKLGFAGAGLGFAAWTVSIVRRAKPAPTPTPSVIPPTVLGEPKWPW